MLIIVVTIILKILEMKRKMRYCTHMYIKSIYMEEITKT